jgi:hypothetical protein
MPNSVEGFGIKVSVPQISAADIAPHGIHGWLHNFAQERRRGAGNIAKFGLNSRPV